MPLHFSEIGQLVLVFGIQVFKRLIFLSKQKKSEIVTKIQNFRSENVILDEDIEEQKRRNSLLLQAFFPPVSLLQDVGASSAQSASNVAELA